LAGWDTSVRVAALEPSQAPSEERASHLWSSYPRSSQVFNVIFPFNCFYHFAAGNQRKLFAQKQVPDVYTLNILHASGKHMTGVLGNRCQGAELIEMLYHNSASKQVSEAQ